MKTDFLEKLKNGTVKREDLSEILAAIKEDIELGKSLKAELSDGSLLLPLLSDEDAKTRKNAAKLIGVLQLNNLAESVFEAYKKETVLFIRPTMLEAICELNDRSFIVELKARLRELENTDFLKEEMKHISEEIRFLREYTGETAEAPHTFTGYAGPAEVVIYTPAGFENLTVEQTKNLNPRALNGCVRVSAGFIRDVLPIRTAEEFLLLIPDFKITEFDPEALAESVADSRLYAFLDRRHKEQGRPYRFRAELRSKLDSEKRIAFVKRFSAALESRTGYKFINSINDYEIELRVIERKDGKGDCLLKLFTLKDERFAYRKESIAAGLKPSTAAVAVAFAKPYLKENAQILDPFCGAATLLLERAIALKPKNIYGTDTFGPAIEKARKNTIAAGFKGNYINRDFFDFRHEYLFDEIVTELPYYPEDAEPSVKAAMKLTYRHFLEKAPGHLVKNGILVVLAKHTDMFENFVERFEYKVLASSELPNKEKIYILQTNL